MKALERENRELWQANEILPRRSSTAHRSDDFFIDEHRSSLGVESICSLLPIAPSTYYEVVAKRTDVGRLSARARRDMAMRIEIRWGRRRTSIAQGPEQPGREFSRAASKAGADDAGISIRRRLATVHSIFSALRNLFVPPHQKNSALAIHIHRIRAMAQWKAVTGATA
jgi:hypothetical protein